MRAYTVGNPSSYDRDLTQGLTTKLGQRLEEDPPYDGGWVWRTYQEVLTFLQHTPPAFPAAVYALELPNGWEVDVSPELHPEDGVHRLLNDATILYRINMLLIAHMRDSEKKALLLDYTAIADTNNHHPAVRALPLEQHLWCPQLDDAYLPDDLSRLLEVGILQWHPERGSPFLSLGEPT